MVMVICRKDCHERASLPVAVGVASDSGDAEVLGEPMELRVAEEEPAPPDCARYGQKPSLSLSEAHWKAVLSVGQPRPANSTVSKDEPHVDTFR